MASRRQLIAWSLAAIASAAASACVTRPVPSLGVGAEGPQRIEVSRGDNLRILTRDGRRRTVRIQNADATALYSARETILISDLVFVEREEFSGGNAALVGGTVVLIVLIAPVVEAMGAAAVWAAAVPN